MKRWKRACAAAFCLLMAASLALASALGVFAAGDSVPVGTDGIGELIQISVPEGYKGVKYHYDLEAGITQDDFGKDKAGGLYLELAGVRSSYIEAAIAQRLEGDGKPDYFSDDWAGTDWKNPYKDMSTAPSTLTKCETEGVYTRVFAPHSHAVAVGVATAGKNDEKIEMQYRTNDVNKVCIERDETNEDLRYEGLFTISRSARDHDYVSTGPIGSDEVEWKEVVVEYSIASEVIADITNITYDGNAVYADIKGYQWARCNIVCRMAVDGNRHIEDTADRSYFDVTQVPCTIYQDEDSGFPVMTLSTGDVTFYFYIWGVRPGTGEKEIFQEVTGHAQEDPGEDSGAEIDPGIINGGKDKKPGNLGLAIAVGLTGTAAALVGTAAATAAEKESKKSRYKMYISKHFGDVIKKGAPPCWVYARIAEVRASGEEVDRPDLSARIEPYCENEVLDVRDGGMAENYRAAQVFAYEDTVDSEGTVSFQFRGPGGTFVRHVTFSLEELQIVFAQENLGLPAHYEKEVSICFGIVDAPEKVDVTVVMVDENAPYSVEKKEDPKIKGLYYAVIRDKRMDDEGEPGDTKAWRMRVRAEWDGPGADGKTSRHYKEKDFHIYRIFMGLVLQLEADAIGCHEVLRDGANIRASLSAGGTDLAFDLYTPELAIDPTGTILASGLKGTVGASTGRGVSDDDRLPAMTEGSLLLLNWNDEEQDIERVAVYPEKQVAVKALRVVQSVNALVSDAGEAEQEMVEKLEIRVFPKRTLEEDGARQITFCCTKAVLDRPIRLWAEVTVTAKYNGKTYTAKKKVLLHSMPFRNSENYEHFQKLLQEDDRIRIFLQRVRDEIWDKYMYCLSSLHFLAERMIDGYDRNFGYDPSQVFRVADYWIKFLHGQVIGRNDIRQKPDIRDDIAFWVDFAKGMRDNNGFLGRVLLGVCTHGFSETVFFAMELHDKMKEEVFKCRDDSFGCWEGIKLGAYEYGKQAVTEAVIGGTLKLGGFMGNAILSDAVGRDTTISQYWRQLMNNADEALRARSRNYRVAAQTLEKVQGFATAGAKGYKAALEKAAAEEEALGKEIEQTFAQRRMGKLNLTKEKMVKLEASDIARAEAMENLKALLDAGEELSRAKRVGGKALEDAQKAYDAVWYNTRYDKNNFKALKEYNGPMGQQMRAKFAEVRRYHDTRIMDAILDDVSQQTGIPRNELYIEKISGHMDDWKELAGLEMPEDMDMNIRQVCYTGHGDHVLVSNRNVSYTSIGKDPIIAQKIGENAMARNVYKEFHGGEDAPDLAAAKEFTQEMDYTYVQPVQGLEGDWEITLHPEAYAELGKMIDPKQFGDELKYKRLNQLTVEHKVLEWHKRANKKFEAANIKEQELRFKTGEERLKLEQEIKTLRKQAVGCEVESVRTLNKTGNNIIAPRAEARAGKGLPTAYNAKMKKIVEAAKKTYKGMEAPVLFEDYLEKEFGLSYEEGVKLVASGLE